MSFKLSELLNPAEENQSSSRRYSQSQSQSQSQSPPAPGASHFARGGQVLAHAQAVTSSYEAASALTALATSGGALYSPAYATTTAHPPQRSPTLPSLPWPPPSSNTIRRASHTSLPPFERTPSLSLSHHVAGSPISDLEQYRSSRSPDELRRGSLSYSQFGAEHTGAMLTPGPILAPLHEHTSGSGAPHMEGDRGPTGAGQGADLISKNASASQTVASATSSHPPHPTTSATPSSSHIHKTPLDKIFESSESPEEAKKKSRSQTKTAKDEMDEGEGTTIEQPATSQIREPSSAAPEAAMTPVAPEPAERKPLDATNAGKEASPMPKIKHEDTGTPKDRSPSLKRRESTQVDEDMDEDTLKAIEAAKSDFARKASRAKAVPSIEEPVVNAGQDIPAKNKKRPAPKVKKGQAAKKPPTKKRKVVDDSASDATRLSPSRATKFSKTGHPSGGKKSKSNTPALGSSPAPGSVVSEDQSAYGSDAGGDDDSDDNSTYCICKRGDNHTWMIACDGGCEDWFHGKCVNILEDDGDLIDKYICPNCAARTPGKVTTWLPGCRNTTCRKPARIMKKSAMSKYCSDKCGFEFMAANVKRSERERRIANGGGTKESRPKRRGLTQAEINGDGGENSDDDLGPRGGALKASELKALVTSANGDISAFRDLGKGIMSPPATASPTAERFPADALSNSTSTENLTPSEKARIEGISREKDDLRRRRALLKDRERFGQLIRENVARYAEREKVKPKDVCGYDNRLTWSEEEFKIWRDSEEGQATLSSGGVLEVPEVRDAGKEKAEVNGNSSDHMDVDESPPATDDAQDKTKNRAMSGTFCAKKRCGKHMQWQKAALADVRFEESTLADSMRALEKEEREIRELGALRGRMEKGGLGGEGSVEVVNEA